MEEEKKELYVVVPSNGSNYIIASEHVASNKGYMTITYRKDDEANKWLHVVGKVFIFEGFGIKKDAIFFAENLPGQVVWFNTYEEEKSLDDNTRSL